MVAEALVVEGQHLIVLAPLQVIERAVPPQVMHKVVGAGPVGFESLQPRDALASPALHLQHMCDRVCGPHVTWVEVYCRPACSLGDRVTAGLLVRKGPAGEHRAKTRQIFAPAGQHRLDRPHHKVGLTEPEGDKMMKAEGEHVVGLGDEDLLPVSQRPFEIARDPVTERGKVRPFAAIHCASELSCRGFRLASCVDEGLLETQHREVSLEHMAHTELGLEFTQGAQTLRGIGAILQIAGERVVEGTHRLG
jgi:hypothetical protein